MMNDCNRRTFIERALGLASLSLTSPVLLGGRCAAQATRPTEAVEAMVLLQLSGGNDGLSTVIPYADDGYASARHATRFKPNEVLPIDNYVGLHPELKFLRSEYEEGRLSIVQGVGYPNPNRSHFKSMDIWHSASKDGRAVKSGWVGRLSEVLAGTSVNTERIIHIGGSLPFSLYSNSSPAVSFVQPGAYRWLKNESEMVELSKGFERRPNGAALGHLRTVMRDAAESSFRIREATSKYESTTEYPNGSLASSLRTAAALLKSDLGCRVVSLEHDGYDTHQNQRGTHTRQMAELDQALKAFRQDLGDSNARRRTAIVIFSEFGRRVVENASLGTDHGTAAPVFLIGDGVAGGLQGQHPSLVDRDGDDLIFTTDFRSIYATVIEAIFKVDPTIVLGTEFERLPLFV